MGHDKSIHIIIYGMLYTFCTYIYYTKVENYVLIILPDHCYIILFNTHVMCNTQHHNNNVKKTMHCLNTL